MGRSKGSLSSRQASPMRTVHNPEDSEPGEVKITYMTSEEIAAKYGPPSRKPKGIVICLNDEQVEGGEVDVSGKTKLEIAEAKWPKDKFVKATEGMTLNQITKATELSQYQVVHLRRKYGLTDPRGQKRKEAKAAKTAKREVAAAKEPEHPVTAMAEAFKEAGVKDEPKETNAEIGRVLNQMKELSDKVAALEAENKNMRQWINEMLKPVEVGALEEREGPAIPDIHKMVQKLDIKGLGFLDPDEATLYQSLAVLTELVMEQTVERLHYRIEKHFHTTLSIDDGIKHQHEKREMRHARERIVGNGS